MAAGTSLQTPLALGERTALPQTHLAGLGDGSGKRIAEREKKWGEGEEKGVELAPRVRRSGG